MAAHLEGVAGFGIGLAAHAQFPGIRADREVTGEADAAIRQGESGGEGKAEGMEGVDELTHLARRGCREGVGQGDVWGGLVEALLAADPLGRAVVIVMAVAEEAISQWAEGEALVIVAAFEAGEGRVIALSVEQADGAQGFQFIMDIAQDVLIAFTGIPQQFANGQIGETGAPVVVKRWSLTLAGVQGPVSGQRRKRRSSTRLKALDL